jgi:hypothetical protein
MTLPSTGPLTLSQMAGEYGIAAPVPLSAFVGKNGLPGAGPINWSGFLGKSNAQVWENATGVDVQRYDLWAEYVARFGTPSAPVLATFVNRGRLLGTDWALVIGQQNFPEGSTITVENFGHILGQAGNINSGQGGHCIRCDTGSPGGTTRVDIINRAGGLIYSGGGGGGVGGAGGGGAWQAHTSDNCYTVYDNVGGAHHLPSSAYWPQPCLAQGLESYDCRVAVCSAQYGGTLCSGPIQYANPADPYNDGLICPMCVRPRTQCDPVYTWQYSSGGGGGQGAYGIGWNNGDTANGRTGGAAGGSYAGAGGAGGYGGAWGTTGGTGETGAAGNNGAGAGGAAGGAPGYWMLKGGANVGVTNEGDIKGLEG